MKLKTGVRLLRLLSTQEATAMTTKEIHQRWRAQGGPEVTLRSIQRYMADMSETNENGPALVQRVKSDQDWAYYLEPTQVANWFMTEEGALDLVLRRNVFGDGLGPEVGTNDDKLADMATRVVEESDQTKRIRDRLRIAPDGIGRLPAKIAQLVLRACVEAIGKDRQITIRYGRLHDPVLEETVTPLGLVAKDGTIYLVVVKGLNDKPYHVALHRMLKAEMHYQQAQHRPDFDLQRHIEETHQFSHVLDEAEQPLELNLRVAPGAFFHFKERPLSANQTVTPPEGDERWYVVKATVPRTKLLVPFLVSMGPWIEVVAPANVRAETAKWIAGMAAHYPNELSGQ